MVASPCTTVDFDSRSKSTVGNEKRVPLLVGVNKTMSRIPSNKILRCSTGLKVAGLLVAIFFSRPTNQLCAEPVLDKALTDLNSADTVFNTQIVEASE